MRSRPRVAARFLARASPGRRRSARWSRPARPRPTTSAATSTRRIPARIRRGCRGSTPRASAEGAQRAAGGRSRALRRLRRRAGGRATATCYRRRRRSAAEGHRTRVCDTAAAEHDFRPHIDGAWYRCCGGHVRKLVDCCGPSKPHQRRQGAEGLLLPRPQGVLRHVLRHERPVLTAIVVAVAARGRDHGRVVAVRVLDGRDARARGGTPAAADHGNRVRDVRGRRARRRRS